MHNRKSCGRPFPSAGGIEKYPAKFGSCPASPRNYAINGSLHILGVGVCTSRIKPGTGITHSVIAFLLGIRPAIWPGLSV
jgi:hypothetical protein